MKNKATIYTKFCLNCVWPEEWIALQEWARRSGIRIIVKRTSYDPVEHQNALKYRGGDYKAFVLFDGKATDFDEFINKIKGEKCDVQRSIKSKKSIRVDCVENKASEVKVEVKKGA